MGRISQFNKRVRKTAKKAASRGLAKLSAKLDLKSSESKAPPGRSPRRKAVGSTGKLPILGLYSSDDQNTDLAGAEWFDEVRKMMTDPHVRQSVEAHIAGVISANWQIKSASKDPIDLEIADFVRHNLFELMPWRQKIRKIARGSTAEGVYMLEQTEDFKSIPAERFPNHPRPDSAIIISGFHERPASSIKNMFAKKDLPEEVKHIIQECTDNRGGWSERKIESKHLLRWTWDQDGSNFQGIAPLRSAYGPYKLKVALTTLAAIKHERMAVGTPTITGSEDADDDDLDAAEITVESLNSREDAYMVLPYGFTFDWNEGGASGSNIEAAITQSNIDIAHNLAEGFMLLGLTTESGSYALGTTQSGQKHLQNVGFASFITDGFNHGYDGWSTIRRLVDLNYGTDFAAPILEARNLPTRNWETVVDKINNSVNAGTVTADDGTEKEIRDILELGPHDPDTARNPQAAPITPVEQDISDE